DFGIATSVRTILIDNLKSDTIDNAVIAQCTEVQKHYNAFADGFNPPPSGAVASGLDLLHRQVVVDQGGKRIVFHLLNSAWVSQLHEKPGSLYFPVKLVRDRIANAPQADIVLAVVHHPFNWYVPENGRELRKCLEDNADLILTGHEHVQGAFSKKTDVGEQNEYLEGGVLQETRQPDVSSFNLVIFDTVQGQQQTFRFIWRGDQYEPEGEPFWRPFERNKRLTRNQFQFSDGFAQWLEDPGAGYTHPQKEQLTLSDLFIYPDLQEVHYQREASERRLVRSREVLTSVLNNKRVIIVAEEKAGKTSLAKSLVKDLHRNGKAVVLLAADSVPKAATTDKLRKAVNSILAEQYGPGLTDRFWQQDKEKRAVVVDDFHKVAGNRKSKDALLELLTQAFDLVVLLAGEEFRMEELAVPSESTSPIWGFKQYNVLQFGHALRSQLIEKWCRIGRDFSDEEADIERVIRRAEDQITKIISIDFLPSFPVFILILLQQFESAVKLTTTSGSFGYLYEVLVTASLSRHKALRDKLDTMYTYLSEFAYHLFSNKKRSLCESDVRRWHDEHCKEYRLPLDFGPLWSELITASVIDSRHDDFRFRYKYLYYFFVARYFRDNINKPEIQDHIKALSGKLYHERSANIMIFLCHLSKDERVLDAMLAAARALFTNSNRFDVSKQTAFLNRLTSELPQLVLKAGDPKENRIKAMEERDAAERLVMAKRNDEGYDDEEVDEKIEEILQHNAAFKTIQILGQVLKNFTGSLRGGPKRQLVEECYGLGLRVLGNIFHLAELGFPHLVEIVTAQGKARKTPATTVEIQKEVSQLFVGLLQMVSFNVFKHVSDSVGTEKVAQTLEEVVKSDENPSTKVLDLSVRLDHYDKFPQSQIAELAKEFADNIFALGLVRQLVWNHLYMYRVDYRQKQSACEKLGISIESQTKLLTHDTKVNSGPGQSARSKRHKK
ncbi:MAG: metallophosphoesterase, partial [Gemmataceae bacterium]